MPSQQIASSPYGQPGSALQPPEILIDLVADNAQLRVALALSEGAGVRRDLITQELKHRIGNLLTVVQAIARKTFASTDAASVADFNARLGALATAQALLIDSETRAAMLSEVVRAAVAAHRTEGDHFRIAGLDMSLDGRRAHALTLALHELATNAAKYGALSVEGGWIEITWSETDGQFNFLWREHDGPPVTAPTRNGFGSRLITTNLGVAFLGVAELHFNATGLECRLRGAR
jgi:two-component sensor histidine kinase